jgi:hypothetical protein
MRLGFFSELANTKHGHSIEVFTDKLGQLLGTFLTASIGGFTKHNIDNMRGLQTPSV